MIGHFLLIALRNLFRNKIFAGINVIGFSIGLACFILLFFYIRHETSHDTFHADYQQIYQVVDTATHSAQMDHRLKQYLIDIYPEVEVATMVNPFNQTFELLNEEGNLIEVQQMILTDSGFFRVFSFPLIEGNPGQVFSNPYSMVVTESTARKLYGQTSPIGQTISINNHLEFTITGIAADPPPNSSIQFDVLGSAHQGTHMKMICSNCNPSDPNDPNIVYPYQIFIKLQKNAGAAALADKFDQPVVFNESFPQHVAFQPLKDLYLFNAYAPTDFKQGNIKLLKIVGAIAFIILLLAVVNYINLTISRSSLRNKEIGIKCTIGANRQNIIFQFILESSLICLISLIIGLLISYLLFPEFVQMMGSAISLPPFSPVWIGSILLLSLVLGVLTGIIPGYIFSKIRPAVIVSGKITNRGRYKSIKSGFNVFQFTIAIGLLSSLLLIEKQLHYVKFKDLGFDHDQLLYVDTEHLNGGQIAQFQRILRQHHHVESTSMTGGIPGEIRISYGYGEDLNKKGSASVIYIDTSFFETFEVKLAEGRKMLTGDLNKVCYLNRAALRDLGLENYEGEKFHDQFEIIGIVEDFHFKSLHEQIAPLCLIYLDNPTHLNLRISGNVHEVMTYIWQQWKTHFPDQIFQYQFYDSWFDSMYQQEEQLSRIITFFTILALIISSLGILGLAEFMSKQRTKEIGIRKVVGASVKSILMLLSKDFARLVLVAFVVAVPVSTYAVNQWLQNFSYQTTMDWWIFAVAGFGTMLIALLTVSFQTLKAALANPVEALKNE